MSIIPKKFNVYIFHDDYTPTDFVLQVLLEIFGKSKEEAVSIMMETYKSGRSIAGIYVKEIAIEKCMETFQAATYYNFPLKTSYEEMNN